MRRFIGGLVIAGCMLLGGANQAMAQKTIAGRELNQRIQALRDKLHNYQSRNVKADPLAGADSAGLILEQPEIKGEKIVEELESRKDVAVTVLFHDSEAIPATDASLENAAASSTETREASLSAVKQSAEPRPPMVASVKTMLVSSQASNSTDSRTKRYEELGREFTRQPEPQDLRPPRSVGRLPDCSDFWQKRAGISSQT